LPAPPASSFEDAVLKIASFSGLTSHRAGLE